MRISEFLSTAAQILRQAGVDSPRLEAELLLATALGIERKRLFLEANALLTNAEVTKANELVELRAARFPLQYITGKIEFLGLEFSVRPGVFIPRPETELLVVEAGALLSGLVSPVVLDVGTGSGVIAIALAVGSPTAQVHALDVSARAIEVAGTNAVKHGVADRVSLRLGDFSSVIGPEFTPGTADLIVSNPPYVPSSQIPSLAPEISKHEPIEALDGGPDGLLFVRAILGWAATLLKPGRWVLLEMGAGQAEAAREIATSVGLANVRTVRDLAGIDRVLVARRV
ncbi:MAG: peptide chain release factor N(5)-glutamine methyltransferase [Candidatus Eisenbacteria bacterium]|nr:peptide chain release factor N(5)-glutamine methyltransferase [Candidatus Eisenbacteria bacterium]